MDFSVNYEVAVAGGGIAGIAAAIRAARSGKRTVLLEKTLLPGGLATSGLVYIYLPLCDGRGRQLTFGLAEELLRSSLTYGPGEIPPPWNGATPPAGAPPARFRCVFSPAAYMLALDELLEDAGVDCWFDTLVCGVEQESGRLRALVVENESGRGRIEADAFIDATGSCAVCRRAGVPCHDERNALTMWALEYRSGAPNGDLGPELALRSSTPFPEDWSRVPESEIYRGLSGKLVSRFALESRRVLREHYREVHRSGRRSRRDNFALKLPLQPQFRKLYAIAARYVLDSGEDGRYVEDSIGLVGDWRRPGPVWELPWRILQPAAGPVNLLAAGRNVGARNDAWEITRVIPSAALTGEVAGLAAALAVELGIPVSELPVARLQQKLRELGFKLHAGELAPSAAPENAEG